LPVLIFFVMLSGAKHFVFLLEILLCAPLSSE
jgi:hypothetical protein